MPPLKNSTGQVILLFVQIYVMCMHADLDKFANFSHCSILIFYLSEL